MSKAMSYSGLSHFLSGSTQSTAPATKNYTSKTMAHHWQRFRSVQKVPHLLRGWTSVRCPAPVTENDVLDFNMSRKCHACHEKWTQLKKRAWRASKTRSSEERSPPHPGLMDISQDNFCAVRVSKNSMLCNSKPTSNNRRSYTFSSDSVVLL